MIRLKERYFIKIVPHRGETVHRFEVTRRRLVSAAAAAGAVLLATLLFAGFQFWHARAQVASLQSLTTNQRAQLQSLDKKTAAIRSQLQSVQRQNQEIRQLIGVQKTAPAQKSTASPAVQKTSYVGGNAKAPLAQAVRHVDVLEAAMVQTQAESNALRRLTMHVLNVRHIQELARARALAAIPSIDPVPGAQVVGCYCYRSYPDSEFHPGVDLGANYGDVVHATAAGTVASADWDGGFGMKIDIDHGNGYHTWYAHLSRMDVHAGEFVHKGEAIGLVGSTGFSTGPHLHYQMMLDGHTVDPTPYLDGVPAQVLASLP